MASQDEWGPSVSILAGVSGRPELPVSQFPGAQSLRPLHMRFSLKKIRFKFVFPLGQYLNNQSHFPFLFLSISVHDGFLGVSPFHPHFQICVIKEFPSPLVIFSDLQSLGQRPPSDAWSWLVMASVVFLDQSWQGAGGRKIWTTNEMEVPF